jgi:hypothetical protein
VNLGFLYLILHRSILSPPSSVDQCWVISQIKHALKRQNQTKPSKAKWPSNAIRKSPLRNCFEHEKCNDFWVIEKITTYCTWGVTYLWWATKWISALSYICSLSYIKWPPSLKWSFYLFNSGF